VKKGKEEFFICSECTSAEKVKVLYKFRQPLCCNCGTDLSNAPSFGRIKKPVDLPQPEDRAGAERGVYNVNLQPDEIPHNGQVLARLNFFEDPTADNAIARLELMHGRVVVAALVSRGRLPVNEAKAWVQSFSGKPKQVLSNWCRYAESDKISGCPYRKEIYVK